MKEEMSFWIDRESDPVNPGRRIAVISFGRYHRIAMSELDYLKGKRQGLNCSDSDLYRWGWKPQEIDEEGK